MDRIARALTSTSALDQAVLSILYGSVHGMKTGPLPYTALVAARNMMCHCVLGCPGHTLHALAQRFLYSSISLLFTLPISRLCSFQPREDDAMMSAWGSVSGGGVASVADVSWGDVDRPDEALTVAELGSRKRSTSRSGAGGTGKVDEDNRESYGSVGALK